VCDMTQSQMHARVAALKTLGFRVPTVPGYTVADLPQYAGTIALPAYKALEPCDVIVGADGHTLKANDNLSKLIKGHRPGSSVALQVRRDDAVQTVRVPVVEVPQAGRIIGVDLEPRFDVPITIDIDTSDISGPSAGLAMSLAIIDQLTPGNLTGGKNVAVTGTIDPNGNVGEIGALAQKAVAARAAGAKLFIVPACANDSGRAACLADIATAKKRVGNDVQVVPVSTLARALQVLHDAGGSPLPKSVASLR
jgi:Lon-like protease